jgi:hypothetical protein
MNDDLHSAAEKFLREYLEQTGSIPERVQTSLPVPSQARVAASQTAASDFIKHLRETRQQAKQDAGASSKAERYELEEPQQVVLACRNLRCLTYFYGFKRGLPVFTHDKALAMVINTTGSDELARLLQKDGIETFALTAPEVRKGSL